MKSTTQIKSQFEAIAKDVEILAYNILKGMNGFAIRLKGHGKWQLYEMYLKDQDVIVSVFHKETGDYYEYHINQLSPNAILHITNILKEYE